MFISWQTRWNQNATSLVFATETIKLTYLLSYIHAPKTESWSLFTIQPSKDNQIHQFVKNFDHSTHVKHNIFVAVDVYITSK